MKLYLIIFLTEFIFILFFTIAVEYTGGVPYELLKPVLDKASPQQLLAFEDHNSYMMVETDALWQMHVSRKYRTQRRLENETYREMFLVSEKFNLSPIRFVISLLCIYYCSVVKRMKSGD